MSFGQWPYLILGCCCWLMVVGEIRLRRYAPLRFSPGTYIQFIYSLNLPGQNLPEEQSLNVGLQLQSLHYLPDFNFMKQERDAPFEVNSRNLTNVSYTRQSIYSTVENILIWRGVPARQCILRLICEYSASPPFTNSSLLGQILHILLKPSSTPKEKISKTIHLAEIIGTQEDISRCQQIYNQCKISLLSLFTEWINIKTG